MHGGRPGQQECQGGTRCRALPAQQAAPRALLTTRTQGPARQQGSVQRGHGRRVQRVRGEQRRAHSRSLVHGAGHILEQHRGAGLAGGAHDGDEAAPHVPVDLEVLGVVLELVRLQRLGLCGRRDEWGWGGWAGGGGWGGISMWVDAPGRRAVQGSRVQGTSSSWAGRSACQRAAEACQVRRPRSAGHPRTRCLGAKGQPALAQRRLDLLDARLQAGGPGEEPVKFLSYQTGNGTSSTSRWLLVQP